MMHRCVHAFIVPEEFQRAHFYYLDRRGNSYLIGICLFNVLILYPGTKVYYVWRNKQKAKIWDTMTSEVS